MRDRATIKSIAQDLGISHMTVSRALSDHPNVREETRKAVLEHARLVGYVKSAAASAMRGDSTRIIGLLLPTITNEFYAHFAAALAEECRLTSHQLLIHLTHDVLEQEVFALKQLHEHQAIGIVMVPAPATEPAPLSQNISRIVQLIRHREIGRTAAFVGLDDSAAITRAVEQLVEHGHRQIAYIGGGPDLSTGRSRNAAFLKGLENKGLPRSAGMLFHDKPSLQLGRDSMARIIDSPAITAVICGGFEISNGAVSAYMQATEARRKSITVVGYGDPAYYSWAAGGISTINPPVEMLATRAFELITGDGMNQPDKLTSIFATDLLLRGQLALVPDPL